MDRSLLESPRIEQFLDVALLAPEDLAPRLPYFVLVLELDPMLLQQRAIGLQTTAIDTGSAGRLWIQMAELQKRGKRFRSDGIVRFVFAVAKREGPASSGPVTVGRTQTNDVCLPDERISKLHAYFDVSTTGRMTLVDAGSRNRTYVNGVALEGRQEAIVRSGDRISFADYRMTFFSAPDFQSYVSRFIESAGESR
jgi:hypothetical protein